MVSAVIFENNNSNPLTCGDEDWKCPDDHDRDVDVRIANQCPMLDGKLRPDLQVEPLAPIS